MAATTDQKEDRCHGWQEGDGCYGVRKALSRLTLIVKIVVSPRREVKRQKSRGVGRSGSIKEGSNMGKNIRRTYADMHRLVQRHTEDFSYHSTRQ